MKRTGAEIEQAARRFEALAGEFDPETAEVEDLADLRAIAEAAERTRRDEALLTERVALARAHGRSWNRIAAALGVSRQAARQRFGGKVGAWRPRPGAARPRYCHTGSEPEVRRELPPGLAIGRLSQVSDPFDGQAAGLVC
jgi:hypothetical protein